MKLLILANPDNPHTIKWVKSLSKEGFQIYLFGLNEFDETIYEGFANVKVESVGLNKKFTGTRLGNFSKISYIRFLPEVRKIIKSFQPDILHAHYASSYGILGALTGFKPFVISVWGSDVYKFPKISFFHRLLLKFSLRKANFILSTSEIMKSEIEKYTQKNIEVIPFGVDVDTYNYTPASKNGETVIGTVKNLRELYGIDVLIKAFDLVVKEKSNTNLKLLIVGEGTERQRLTSLVNDLGLDERVEFAGKVEPEKIPYYLNKMDIFAALSIGDESFGVSVLEAASCELPVVVSNAPGFNEIVEHETTGLIVQRNSVQEAAKALKRLIDDKEFGKNMGRNGRKTVMDKYDLRKNVETMKEIYQRVITQ